MARRNLEELPDFRLDVSWPDKATGEGIPLLDSSVGRLGISVQDTSVTAFQSDKGDVGTELTMPLYNVVEWMVSNWWALLFEPRKSDQIEHSEDDVGFRARHWLGYAREGFALPDLWFYPLGDEIEIAAYAKYLRFARITFLNSASVTVPTELAWAVLSTFVEDVLGKITAAGIKDTPAHEMWERVVRTPEDAESYCRLIGSLGLSPYEQHENIDRIIDMLMERTPPSILTDLFQASDDSTLRSLADLTQEVWDSLQKNVHEINIEPLADIDLPNMYGVPPWQWGKEAAKKVRTHLGIAAQDPGGGHAFFDALGIDPSSAQVEGLEGSVAARLSGGMKRDENVMQIALSESQFSRRRFAAARGAFLGWSSGARASRLITSARTREQSGSRAFAAEVLAPSDYIRRRAGGSAISMHRVEEIAAELDVSPAVVKWQAQNSKMHVVDFSTW